MEINIKDFENKALKQKSYARPTILFTIHKSRINYKVGKLKKEKIKALEKKLIELFSR